MKKRFFSNLIKQRHVLHLVGATFLLLLLVSFVPPVYGGEPEGSAPQFKNIVVEGVLPQGSQEQLNSVLYQALKGMEPNLKNYIIEAETRPLGQKNGASRYLTEVTLLSRISKQAYVFGITLGYSAEKNAWTVLKRDSDYIPPVASQPESAVKGSTNARVAAFAPISGECPKAAWAAEHIAMRFRAGMWRSDFYVNPNAKEATVWPYLKSNNKLETWYSNSHGVTSASDGTPCKGLVYNGGKLMYNEFQNMASWNGLSGSVCYIDACNSFMNPLRKWVCAGHGVWSYIGGKRLMPFTTSDKTDERFWEYVLKSRRTMSYALTKAMDDFGLAGYYAISGYKGTYGPARLRVKLTWGTQPRDIDTYCWLPKTLPADQHYQIYYYALGNEESHPYVHLDKDDTDDYGPEWLDICQAYEGTYVYAVHQFSHDVGEANLGGCGAKVRIYRGDTLWKTYTVPSGEGDWWHVFDFNATTGTIVPFNTIGGTAPSPYASSPMSAGAEEKMPPKGK